jgi:hypothetical protein
MYSRILPCSRFCRCFALLALSALVGGLGCGGAKEARDSVSGKVTLNGEPINGMISFRSGENETSPVPILNGIYKIENPPKGEVDIIIKEMPGMEGINTASPQDVSKTTVKMAAIPPARYAVAGALPRFTVTGGKQTHDIPLTP